MLKPASPPLAFMQTRQRNFVRGQQAAPTIAPKKGKKAEKNARNEPRSVKKMSYKQADSVGQSINSFQKNEWFELFGRKNFETTVF